MTRLRATLLLFLACGCGGRDTPAGDTDGTTGAAELPPQELYCVEPGWQPVPLCVEGCIDDLDIATPILDANCVVTETRPGEPPVELPECEEIPLGWGYEPPEGASACAVLRTDPGIHNPDPLDDLSPECEEAGSYAEVQVVRDGAVPDGTCVSVTCVASDLPELDCPQDGA